MERIAFPMMRLETSQMPMGRTPGFLSKGIRRHAARADIVEGSITSVHKRRPRSARASQRLFEWDLNAVQRRLQLSAFIPHGPAAPFVRSAA